MNVLLVCFFFLHSAQSLILDENAAPQNTVDALQIMLAEEKQLRMQLGNQVQALENRMGSVESFQKECGCDGRPTGNPAFMAALSKDLIHCSKGQPVIFDSEKLNSGSAYNNIHGIFTAPITGTYMFTATLSVMPNNAYHTAFVKNNATNEIGYLYTDPINLWLERSTTVLTHLDSGDEIWMVCLSDSRIEGDHNHGWEGANDFHSHMSGFLLSAD
ncbi:complement C1q tumor necrosis factor-related protein 4-like [Mercenaria mercenaria]|uniref:complement C1q tumor necrosis factor-related protein 4-like n=1 Tax=Mercenaria mercenaria TaxID=6596 RepID=UPI00234EE4B3|nr:complement C1q tumor necrosis factor-related protein 4-like [Mercenaria mercenaria]